MGLKGQIPEVVAYEIFDCIALQQALKDHNSQTIILLLHTAMTSYAILTVGPGYTVSFITLH